MDTKPIDAEIVEPQKGNGLALVDAVPQSTLAIRNPSKTIAEATEIANALAEIINTQKLFAVISNRKYVVCEGWTTLGAILGVIPVEEYCRALPEDSGFESKINLIRAADGRMVGSASAECTRSENTWKLRSSYALRSMSLTRATSKAFRLSFSWIMKLAGFEATPAEEMVAEDAGGSAGAAQAVAKRKLEEFQEKQRAQMAQTGKEPVKTTPKPQGGDFNASVAETDAERINAEIFGDANEDAPAERTLEPLPLAEGMTRAKVESVTAVKDSKDGKKKLFTVTIGGIAMTCFHAKLHPIFARNIGKLATFKPKAGKGSYGPTLDGITECGDEDMVALQNED